MQATPGRTAFRHHFVVPIVLLLICQAILPLARAATPPNDNFADRIAISTPGQPISGTTLDATGEADEPSGTTNSVWYSWSASAGQDFVPVIESSTFPLKLTVFTGDALTNLTTLNSQPFYPGGVVYQMRIDGAFGAAGNFTFSIRTRSSPAAPLIVHDPQPTVVTVGQTNILSVDASGEALQFQWFKGATALPNETNANLLFRSAEMTDTADYAVTVSNSFGTATSRSAHLSVFPPFSLQVLPVRAHGLIERSQFYGVAVRSNGLIYASLLAPRPGIEQIDLIHGSTNLSASLTTPDLMTYDPQNDIVYFTDASRSGVYKIQNAAISRIAGSINSGFQDGPADTARFYLPRGVALGPDGAIYVVDAGNYVIRKIQNGTVSTIAGQRGKSGSRDGRALEATFSFAAGIVVDPFGNLLIVDEGNYTIRKITTNGLVSTLAGYPRAHGTVDGRGFAARFEWPSGLALDDAGNLLVTERTTGQLRLVTPDGDVLTISRGRVGNTIYDLRGPYGIAVDPRGNFIIADLEGQSLWRGFWNSKPQPPVITQQPINARKLNAGEQLSLFARADGANPISFQWYRNEQPVEGATTAELVLTNVSRAAAGNYYLAVSNSVGVVTTTNSTVTVRVPQSWSVPTAESDGIVFSFAPSDGFAESGSFIPRIEVQSSTNLIDWEHTELSLQLTNGQFRFDQPTNEKHRFFRTHEP